MTLGASSFRVGQDLNFLVVRPVSSDGIRLVSSTSLTFRSTTKPGLLDMSYNDPRFTHVVRNAALGKDPLY